MFIAPTPFGIAEYGCIPPPGHKKQQCRYGNGNYEPKYKDNCTGNVFNHLLQLSYWRSRLPKYLATSPHVLASFAGRLGHVSILAEQLDIIGRNRHISAIFFICFYLAKLLIEPDYIRLTLA